MAPFLIVTLTGMIQLLLISNAAIDFSFEAVGIMKLIITIILCIITIGLGLGAYRMKERCNDLQIRLNDYRRYYQRNKQLTKSVPSNLRPTPTLQYDTYPASFENLPPKFATKPYYYYRPQLGANSFHSLPYLPPRKEKVNDSNNYI